MHCLTVVRIPRELRTPKWSLVTGRQTALLLLDAREAGFQGHWLPVACTVTTPRSASPHSLPHNSPCGTAACPQGRHTAHAPACSGVQHVLRGTACARHAPGRNVLSEVRAPGGEGAPEVILLKTWKPGFARANFSLFLTQWEGDAGQCLQNAWLSDPVVVAGPPLICSLWSRE